MKEPATASRTSLDKPLGDVELVENAPDHNVQQFYAPQSTEEQKLDRSINLKLDCIILPVLALNFMVRMAATDSTGSN
jgi:hypothetical protein